MPKKLLLPEDLRELVVRRYNNQHQNWIAGEGAWPWSVPLGVPTERDVSDDAKSVRAWVDAWEAWAGEGELRWVKRQFGRMGTQRFPECMIYGSPTEAAGAASQSGRWSKAVKRYSLLATRWPELGQATLLRRNFNVLADYADEDFGRLMALLEWLDANPASGHHLRQLPVEGLDTKWAEKRRGLITDLVGALRPAAEARDFYSICGLAKPSHRIRICVLCPKLRAVVGGLRDIESPVEEVGALPIAPKRAVVVENLETGLALPDVEDCIVIMKLGNAVSVVDRLPWLKSCEAVYWGDIDTHGFVILDRARAVLPKLRSVLMDQETLLAHKTLWSLEHAQATEAALERLTSDERAVFSALKANTWGQGVRLEQERLGWAGAMRSLLGALALAADGPSASNGGIGEGYPEDERAGP
jgi:hypothetical protein